MEASAPLVRELIDVGRLVRRAPMLAVQPDRLAALGEGPASDPRTSTALTLLAEARKPLPAIELSADAQRLTVVLDTTLTTPGGLIEVDDDHPGLRVVPIVQTRDGSVVALPEAIAVFRRLGQRLEFAIPGPSPAEAPGVAPRLLEVQIRIFVPGVTTGDVALVRVEDSAAASGDDWRVAVETSTLAEAQILMDAGPNDFVFEGSAIVSTADDPLFPFIEPQPVFRWQPFGVVIPPMAGVASSAFLAATGAAVGDDVEIDWYFQRVPVEIVAEIPTFPTSDPGDPLLIVDRQTLAEMRHVLGLAPPPSVEWWLAVADGQGAAVADALRASDLAISQLVSRSALASALERDPIALGMVGALALGSIAAGMLAVIAFIVTAVLAAREQLDEYALLRALGMSRGQIAGWLVFDHVFLLAAGLIAGGAIGSLLAALVVPHATLTSAGVQVVPSGGTVVHLVGYGDGSKDLRSDAAVTVAMDTPYVLAGAKSKVLLACWLPAGMCHLNACWTPIATEEVFPLMNMGATCARDRRRVTSWRPRQTRPSGSSSRRPAAPWRRIGTLRRSTAWSSATPPSVPGASRRCTASS